MPHPYIPNSAPEVRAEMLRIIGAKSIDDLYMTVPKELRYNERLPLEEGIPEEGRLRRHVTSILNKNTPASEMLSFLGAGCYQHEVPAVCDEINRRGEFVTSYAGDTYGDHGRLQALWEFQDLMAELVELDVVTTPNYDWSTAAAMALRSSVMLTGRKRVLVPAALLLDRRLVFADYLSHDVQVDEIPFNEETGLLDLDALRAALADDVAAVYIEYPNALGVIDYQAPEVVELAHEHGALAVVGADPTGLGLLAAPGSFGADFAVGDVQPLGMHMSYGGGLSGYLAFHNDPAVIESCPAFIFAKTETLEPGQNGFGYLNFDRTHYVKRGEGSQNGGTTTALWAITAAAYLGLLGPQGLRELGEGLMQRSRYAAERLGEIPGVMGPRFSGPILKEFVITYDNHEVAAVDDALRARGIFGGKDLSVDFPTLGRSSLWAVTEVHTKDDIDRLVEVLTEVLA